MVKYKILFVAVIVLAGFSVTKGLQAQGQRIPEPVKPTTEIPEPVKTVPLKPGEIKFQVDVRFNESDDYFNQIHVMVKPVPGERKKTYARHTWPEEIDFKKPPQGEMHVREWITYEVPGDADLVQVQLWRLSKEKRPKWKTPDNLMYRVVSPAGPFNVSLRGTDLPGEDAFGIIRKPGELNGKVIQIR